MDEVPKIEYLPKIMFPKIEDIIDIPEIIFPKIEDILDVPELVVNVSRTEDEIVSLRSRRGARMRPIEIPMEVEEENVKHFRGRHDIQTRVPAIFAEVLLQIPVSTTGRIRLELHANQKRLQPLCSFLS